MVEVRGFEPPASSSRTKHATRLRHTSTVWHSLTQQLKNGNGGVCSLLSVKCFARRQFSVVDPA